MAVVEPIITALHTEPDDNRFTKLFVGEDIREVALITVHAERTRLVLDVVASRAVPVQSD